MARGWRGEDGGGGGARGARRVKKGEPLENTAEGKDACYVGSVRQNPFLRKSRVGGHEANQAPGLLSL